MNLTQWILAFLVLVAAYVAAQGISILLYRPRVVRRNSPRPTEAELARVAQEAAAKARREVEDEVRGPRRQATWASGVRSSRRREEDE